MEELRERRMETWGSIAGERNMEGLDRRGERERETGRIDEKKRMA